MRESLKSANLINRKAGLEGKVYLKLGKIIWKQRRAGRMNAKCHSWAAAIDGNNQKGNDEEKINKKDLGIVVAGTENVLCCHGKGGCRRCEMILLLCSVLSGPWLELGAGF